MKTTTCDVCKQVISDPGFVAAKTRVLTASFDAERKFSIEIASIASQFDTTDFDVCRECYGRAVKQAVAEAEF